MGESETLISALAGIQRGKLPQDTQNLFRMLHNGYAKTCEATYSNSNWNGSFTHREYHIELTDAGIAILEGAE